MSITISKKTSRDKSKFWYYEEWGKEAGQRRATGVFTYVKPANQVQKNHNKEALAILEIKQSQLTLDSQAIGTGYIPVHKFRQNFLDFFEEYVKNNSREGKRHLQSSFTHFKAFIKKKFVAPIEMTENLCQRYRSYLLDRFRGDTPMNYFSEFKRMIKTATKQGYFRTNPAEDVKAKQGRSGKLKENLKAEEYMALLNTPCLNEEVREAFIFCCYTGLRWVDVKSLAWLDIGNDTVKTRLIQAKTGEPVVLTLHGIAKAILDKRKARFGGHLAEGIIFKLPTADGANKILGEWLADAKIGKHVTWSCARLSFSILLQDKRVDDATVALLLGHTSTKYVHSTYKRHRPKDQTEIIAQLPSPEWLSFDNG